MKKKLLATALVVTMVLSMTACGDKEASTNTDLSNSETKESSLLAEGNESGEMQEEKKNDVSEEPEEPEGLPFFYEDHKFGYKVWLPGGYHERAGYGYLTYFDTSDNGQVNPSDSGAIWITQYSGEVGSEEHLELVDMTQYHDSTDIFDLLIPVIDVEIFASESYTLADYSVEIVETKEINGLEMTKFAGEITGDFKLMEHTATYPFVAWGIKGKYTPVLITFIDKTKEKELYDEWFVKIDTIVENYTDSYKMD